MRWFVDCRGRFLKEVFWVGLLASLMLFSYVEVLTMNFNRKLITGLFGLALIAAPITAAAKDNDSGRNNSHQEQAQPRSNDSHPEARHQEQASHNEGGQHHEAQHAAREQARDQHQT